MTPSPRTEPEIPTWILQLQQPPVILPQRMRGSLPTEPFQVHTPPRFGGSVVADSRRNHAARIPPSDRTTRGTRRLQWVSHTAHATEGDKNTTVQTILVSEPEHDCGRSRSSSAAGACNANAPNACAACTRRCPYHSWLARPTAPASTVPADDTLPRAATGTANRGAKKRELTTNNATPDSLFTDASPASAQRACCSRSSADGGVHRVACCMPAVCCLLCN